jgi:GNAT superfamily N-acetyltransferase
MTAPEEGREAFFVVPERRGRGLPEPPRAAMEILFQVYRTIGGCYTITLKKIRFL